MKCAVWITLAGATLLAQSANVPLGFHPIFNGRDLSGWHISKTNHHGTTPDWRVVGGILRGAQQPAGQGGILLTDRKYRNVEVYLEFKPDWGCDGGLFLRSNERGQAYQVLLDYLPGGNIGGVYGEKLAGIDKPGIRMQPAREWEKYWRKDDWNAVRARITGDVPHVMVWLNGMQVLDWTDTANHAADGAVDGMIAVQVHGGKRWTPEGAHRFRVIAVKELPD